MSDKNKIITGLIANDPKKYRSFIVNKRLNGMSSADIESEFGVSKATVSAWLAHHTRGTYKNEDNNGEGTG